MVSAILNILGRNFQSHLQWKLNIDIISMVLAWGLEFEDKMRSLILVTQSLFDENILLGMDYILNCDPKKRNKYFCEK